ncbi:MAG: tRNA (uridine(34)/cytosine(34)/5-carboxymethylaminomethyluridine(34)-2'-O)-methyltransferase TrmL [Clostridiales bacterium]|nr:tRNA (uridine(34)/cytosine(34)/5-carboxymethylaminomethyluridine(34)-2'-O)-methyltransferase TrmL [Clostridiales bacterium]
MFHIVLYMPEIPANTGNVSRTCAVTGTVLHMIKPLGFSLEDRYLKRAGLDYWHLLDVRIHENLDAFLDLHGDEKLWLVETGGRQTYEEASYCDGSFFVFGRETSGLPMELRSRFAENTVRIPMLPDPKARSLNLSNSVAIVLYEAMRQNGFAGLG